MKFPYIILSLYRLPVLCGMVLIGFMSPCALATPVDDTRAVLKEWVEAEKVLSREREEWRREGALMEDLVAVAEKEIEGLQRKIDENRQSLTRADEERARLLRKRESIREQRELIARFLEREEPRLLALKPRLPTPLIEELNPLFGRMGGGENGASFLAKRMQAALAIMDAIRAFDRSIRVHREMRGASDGTKEEVVVLYLGLAQAFYLSGTDAGIGVRGDAGWEWRSRPGIRGEVRKALSMVEGKTREIGFVQLPLVINENQR